MIRLLRALTLAALPIATLRAGAQTPHAPEPVILLTLRDTSRYAPRVNSITRDAAGRLYLAATGVPPVILPLDGSTGTYLRAADGRQALAGDLAWVDGRLAVGGFQTWHLFEADGAPLGCRAFGRMNNEFVPQVFPRHPLAGELAIGELRPAYPDARTPDALVVSRGQTVVRTLHQRPSGPDRVEVPFPWGGGESWVVVPFRAQTLWTVSDDGAHVVVVESDQPAGPGPHPVRVLRMDTEGRIAYDVRLSLPVRPVTPAERDGQIEDWALWMSSGTIRRDTAAARAIFRERIRFPDYHPAVTEVLVAGDGAAWLRLADADAAAEWIRLDARGRQELRLRVPAAFRAVYADADALWGGLNERGGILRVAAYPLPGRPPLFSADFAGLALPPDPPPHPEVMVRGQC